MFMYIYIYIYMYADVCICKCVFKERYIYIYIYTHMYLYYNVGAMGPPATGPRSSAAARSTRKSAAPFGLFDLRLFDFVRSLLSEFHLFFFRAVELRYPWSPWRFRGLSKNT